MKKRIVLVSVILLLLLLLLLPGDLFAQGKPSKYYPALGTIPVPKKQYRVGCLVKTLINDFWLDLKNGYEAAGKDYKVIVDVYGAPSEADILVQKNILDDMIAKKYDVICVSPITDSNLLAALKKATDAKIPLINTVDAFINPDLQKKHGIKIYTFITTDFAENARLATGYVAKLLGSQGGQIMHIMGMPGNPSAEDRKRGYLEEVAKYPQLKNVGVWAGDWDRKKSMDVAADVMQSYPDLKAIVGANDTIALGALQAVKNAGKMDEVIVAGIDAIPDAIQSILDGELVSTVAFMQFQTAYTAIECAIQIKEGKFDEKKNKKIDVYQELWTKDNIKEKVNEYRDQYTGLRTIQF